jgi:hypothetical protein
MTRGKLWTVDEERELRQMVEAGCNAYEISAKLKRAPNAIYEKAKRLGLNVIISAKKRKIITTNLSMPKDLYSVEEELKVLAAAVDALKTPDLSASEVSRLRGIISGADIYIGRFSEYVNYRRLENELLKVREELRRYADCAKAASKV